MPKVQQENENSQRFSLSEAMTLEEASNFMVVQARLTLSAKLLADTISKSNELKRVISTCGSTKPLKMPALVFRWSVIVDQIDLG